MTGLLPSASTVLHPSGQYQQPAPLIPALAWWDVNNCAAAVSRCALIGAPALAALTDLRALARLALLLRCQLGDELRLGIVDVRPHRTRTIAIARRYLAGVIFGIRGVSVWGVGWCGVMPTEGGKTEPKTHVHMQEPRERKTLYISPHTQAA